MKNGLFKFYLFFMLMSLALFSCENHEISQNSGSTQNKIERKVDERHPDGPNGSSESESEDQSENKKGKKSKRNYVSRSSNWC